MRVEFLVENIESFLPALTKILPVHSQIPVLSNLLLEAESGGLFVSATNLEIGIRIKIPAKVDIKGATTIPGKQFIEVIGSLPKDKVFITLDKESLSVKCRDSKVVFQTISPEEFPSLFEQKGEKAYVFREKELRDVFSKLTFAVSIDESRPELTGILLSQTSEGIDLVATDGFRLSLKKIKGKKLLEDGERLILPARLISEILSAKTQGDITMYVYKKANQVILEADDLVLVGRLISGEFPNYERVIPASSKTSMVLDVEDFLQKVKLSSVFARDTANIIKLKIEGGKARIAARSSGIGEGEADIEGKQEGQDNEIAFNIKFLSDILRNISGKTVTMELSSAIEPAVFKTEEDPGFTHIIMPVRVQD
jgi:DNA polymerase-3 subunit beta